MVLMSSPASSSKGRRKKSSCNSPRDRVVIAFALAIAVLPWVVWDDEQQHVTQITTELRSDIDSDVVILAVTDAETAAAEILLARLCAANSICRFWDQRLLPLTESRF